MYYDPLAEVVVDYFHGLADGKKRVLRMIGDAATRYREDPVRLLRAVRFAAKLGFAIEPKTLAPMREALQLLRNVPASRMFDEMIKLLQTGHAVRSLAELRTHGLVGEDKAHRGIFPILDAVVEAEGKQPERDRFVQLALEDTDRRVGEDKPVAPSFLLACLLWHEVLQRWQKNKARGDAPFPALQDAIDAVFDARVGDISGRGKLGADMREIWSMQPRFERRVGNGPFSLVEQPRFRAGFDFLRLRAAVGEVDESLARWWEEFSSTEDEAERRAMIEDARRSEGRGGKPASGGRVHRVERVHVESDDDAQDDAPAGAAEEGAAPAKKRRRRRRKPAGAGGGSAPQAD
jgi:poly(A) polymerase